MVTPGSRVEPVSDGPISAQEGEMYWVEVAWPCEHPLLTELKAGQWPVDYFPLGPFHLHEKYLNRK